MGIKVKAVPLTSDIQNDQEVQDWDTEQRETTVDGQTFHWSANQERNFLDEGVGVAHTAQLGSPSIVRESTDAFGDSRF